MRPAFEQMRDLYTKRRQIILLFPCQMSRTQMWQQRRAYANFICVPRGWTEHVYAWHYQSTVFGKPGALFTYAEFW
jgi:hypothetical protein